MTGLFSLFSRLKIWHKLALITSLLLLPLPFVVFLFLGEKNAKIAFSSKEIVGAEAILPFKQVVLFLGRYRDANLALALGHAPAQNWRADAEANVDRAFTLADDLERKTLLSGTTYGNELQFTSNLRALQEKWRALKARSTRNTVPARVFEEHTQLITETKDLIRAISDSSNLTLDPDLDTYYLMDQNVVQTPLLIELISQLRAYTLSAAITKQLTPENRTSITVLLGQIQATAANWRNNFQKAQAANTRLRESYSGKMELQYTEIKEHSETIRQDFLSGTTLAVEPQALLMQSMRLLEHLHTLDEQTLDDLRSLLLRRVNGYERERRNAFLLVTLGLLVGLLSVAAIARNITWQANAISHLIGEIERGNLEARARVRSADELGRTARAFNAMLDNTKGLMQSRDERDRIQGSIMRLLEDVSSVADGDLTNQAEVTEDMTGAIADSFNYMISNLREIIGKIQDVSLQVTQTTDDTARSAERLAEGSQVQAERIRFTAAALNEMTAAIQQVNQQAENSVQVAQQSLQTAQRGSAAVHNTINGMGRVQEQVAEASRRLLQLGDRSKEISEIVRLIEEIADRTGVLALNASIQAAAAGEAGYGFSVVASEVEQLSGRATEATKRIGNLIRTIQSGTNEAIVAMEETRREVQQGARVAYEAGEALTEIETVSTQLAKLVHDIALDCQRQADSSQALSHNMTEVATLTNQTTTGVMQSALTVKAMSLLADELRQSVASFKINQVPLLQHSGPLMPARYYKPSNSLITGHLTERSSTPYHDAQLLEASSDYAALTFTPPAALPPAPSPAPVAVAPPSGNQ